MRARRPLPLMVFLWLLTAAGAGLFFAWVQGTEAAGERTTTVVYRDRAGAPPTAPLPGAPTSPPAADLAGAPSPVGPSPAPSSSPARAGDGLPAPPPMASLLVTVLEADGTPVEYGSVYALGAGEEGGDDDFQAFTALIGEQDTEGTGTVRIRVPSAGLYDVGFNRDEGSFLQRDVRVEPGDGNALTFHLPTGVPVQVRIEGTWPPEGALDPRLVVNFWTEDSPRLVRFPGRGDRAYASGDAVLDGPQGDSSPLESGRVYRLYAAVRETATWLAGPGQESPLEVDSPRFVVVADRDTVRPGETLVVGIRKQAALLVRAQGSFPDVDGKTPNVAPLLLSVVRGGALKAMIPLAVARNDGEAARIGFETIPVEPGPALLRWSGTGLEGGERPVQVRAGEVHLEEIRVREDPLGVADVPAAPEVEEFPDEEPEVPGIPVALEGLPPGIEGPVSLFARSEGKEGDFDTFQDEVFPRDTPERWELDGSWRQAREVAAVAPPFLASDYTPMPASGPLRLSLRPAGLLVVVPTEVWPESFGSLVLRRADRRPFAVAEDYGRSLSDVASLLYAEPGALLGPFPEGPVVFEVRLGGLRLPDAKAVVKACRIEVLRISR